MFILKTLSVALLAFATIGTGLPNQIPAPDALTPANLLEKRGALNPETLLKALLAAKDIKTTPLLFHSGIGAAAAAKLARQNRMRTLELLAFEQRNHPDMADFLQYNMKLEDYKGKEEDWMGGWGVLSKVLAMLQIRLHGKDPAKLVTFKEGNKVGPLPDSFYQLHEFPILAKAGVKIEQPFGTLPACEFTKEKLCKDDGPVE